MSMKAKQLRLSRESCGRWVGSKLYWDISGETISDDDLRAWCRQNLSDCWSMNTTGIQAYHTEAYARRRQAIKAEMKNVDFSAAPPDITTVRP